MASIRRLPRDRAEASALAEQRRARAADPSLPEPKPTGRWQVRYRDVDGRERGATFDTEREAKQHRAKVETQLVEGEWVDPAFGEVRLGQWLDLWVSSRVVARTTAAAEESMVRRHLRPAFGERPLRSITRMAVQTWVAQLERDGLAPASISKIYRLLATCLTAAVDEGLLRQTPCRKINLPRARTDERVFLTVEQVEQLLVEVPERYQALVVVAYLTGLRWSELAGLRVKRLDLLRARLEVVEVAQEAKGKVTFGPPKSRASRRVVTLPAAAVDALAAHLARWPAGRDDLVFTSARGVVLSRTRFAQRVLRPAVLRTALRVWAGPDVELTDALEARWVAKGRPGLEPRPTFHSLRHSHVASLIADGAPMKAVQQRIGHGSIRVTFDTYGHLEDTIDEQLLEA